MPKYNILILSNPNDIYAKEDEILAESFRKDGNNVVIKWLDYDETLDNEFNVVLKRDTWAVEEKDIPEFEKHNNILKKRLRKKSIKTVNFYEVGCNGKKYLIDFYKKGLPVIPSFDNIKQAKELKDYSEFVLKPLNSFGSAFGQKSVKKEDLEKEFREGLMIQPKINFKSEIQCYFVEDELLYTFEFKPSKYPEYPEPLIIELTKKEKDIVYKFVDETNIKVGFQRIDFLRLEDGKLLLLEIEANATFMDLVFLKEELRNQVIEKYKHSVYKYLRK